MFIVNNIVYYSATNKNQRIALAFYVWEIFYMYIYTKIKKDINIKFNNFGNINNDKRFKVQIFNNNNFYSIILLSSHTEYKAK